MAKRSEVQVIAFDGNHRTGKGTQIERLQKTLTGYDIPTIALRGDGSRPGTGSSLIEDPVDEWWSRFREFEALLPNPYDGWRIAARKLLAEAAERIITLDAGSVVLFDRSCISRTQMTFKEGVKPTIETMYADVGNDNLNIRTIKELIPDVTIYLHATTDDLLRRLDPSDPKYDFRKANILSSNGFYLEAYHHFQGHGHNAVQVDAAKHPDIVSTNVLSFIMNCDNIKNNKDR